MDDILFVFMNSSTPSQLVTLSTCLIFWSACKDLCSIIASFHWHFAWAASCATSPTTFSFSCWADWGRPGDLFTCDNPRQTVCRQRCCLYLDIVTTSHLHNCLLSGKRAQFIRVACALNACLHACFCVAYKRVKNSISHSLFLSLWRRRPCHRKGCRGNG